MNEGPIIPGMPARRRPAHQPVFESHNRAIMVFVTVCTKDRRPILATPAMHEALRAAWTNAGHWIVGRYVVMPDHVHLFCAPNTMPPTTLRSWVRFWKTSVSNAISAKEGTLWQADCWDTQLRGHEGYQSKWDYVRNNPVRAGLAVHPEEWQYAGELNLLRWHD